VASDKWTKELNVNPEAITLMSPYEAGAILYEQTGTGFGGQVWTILPQTGEPTEVTFAAALSPLYTADNAPGQNSVVAAASSQAGSAYALLDLANCSATGCQMKPLASLPVWSPNGRRTLMTFAAAPPPFYILLGDGEGRATRDVGTGTLPFWLDDEHFGYLQRDVSGSAIVTAALASPTDWHTLLITADLLNALPAAERPEQLAIRQITSNPAAPRWLFIEAVVPDRQSQYIFAFDRESEAVSLRLQVDDSERFIAFRLSPDGRYWTLTTHARDDLVGTNWTLYLHNIARNETEALAFRPLPYGEYSYQWSADGRWLLKADSGVIQLIAPNDDYFKLIYYDGARCTSAVWVQGSAPHSP
jgi:hypothetical protein